MGYRVTVRQVAARSIAVARGRAALGELPREIRRLLDVVWAFVKSANIATTGHSVVVYLDEPGQPLIMSPEGVPLEAGAEVTGPFTESGDVAYSSTPAGTVATTVHVGPYDQLSHAHAAVRDWCNVNDRPILGTSWEFYGHWDPDPSKLTTEVSYLIR